MPNLFKDRQLETFFRGQPSLTTMVLEEHDRQIKKWCVQVHTSWEWLGYTTEELGSLAKAIGEFEYRGGPASKVVDEAIQVATLSLKIAEMFMADKEGEIKWAGKSSTGLPGGK